MPVEQFSLNYSKIEVSYTPQTASGKAGDADQGRVRRQGEQEDLSPISQSTDGQQEPALDEPAQHRQGGAGEI